MTVPADSVEGLYWQLQYQDAKYAIVLVIALFAAAILWQRWISPAISKSGLFRDEKKMHKSKKNR